MKGHHNGAAFRAATNPAPQPRTVTREVPLTVLVGGDGATQTVNHETDEPCYGCSCCALWARSLDQLAAAMLEHEHSDHREDGAPRDFATGQVSCLVCAMLAGQASTGVDGR